MQFKILIGGRELGEIVKMQNVLKYFSLTESDKECPHSIGYYHQCSSAHLQLDCKIREYLLKESAKERLTKSQT